MFKIFYEYKVKNTVSGPLKEEEAVFWWFISTQQGDSESQLFLHESAYSKYRYRLFKALLKSAKNPKLFIKLFNLERRVKEGEKKSIIREVIRREWKSELFRN